MDGAGGPQRALPSSFNPVNAAETTEGLSSVKEWITWSVSENWPTGTVSISPPPSLPMISLVIANLNPRDLMQLARLGIEVVIPRDRTNRLSYFKGHSSSPGVAKHSSVPVCLRSSTVGLLPKVIRI